MKVTLVLVRDDDNYNIFDEYDEEGNSLESWDIDCELRDRWKVFAFHNADAAECMAVSFEEYANVQVKTVEVSKQKPLRKVTPKRKVAKPKKATLKKKPPRRAVANRAPRRPTRRRTGRRSLTSYNY